jgi:hypothetical protein
MTLAFCHHLRLCNLLPKGEILILQTAYWDSERVRSREGEAPGGSLVG